MGHATCIFQFHYHDCLQQRRGDLTTRINGSSGMGSKVQRDELTRRGGDRCAGQESVIRLLVSHRLVLQEVVDHLLHAALRSPMGTQAPLGPHTIQLLAQLLRDPAGQHHLALAAGGAMALLLVHPTTLCTCMQFAITGQFRRFVVPTFRTGWPNVGPIGRNEYRSQRGVCRSVVWSFQRP
jgi:hypothetical protein